MELQALDDPSNPLLRGNARIELETGSRVDVPGALARIERSLAERSTGGGSLSLRSSGELIARPE